MQQYPFLKIASILAFCALILLITATFAGNSGKFPASQELFEFISNAAAYTQALNKAEPNLRVVLYIDAIFALAYTSAISFAIIGFYHRNRPIAWFAGIGIVAVMLLDYVENIMMIQSLDLVALGADITLERIVSQVTISSIKWHGAAAVLFSISFLIPSENLIEKLLVWGTRLGLAFAVPMFVTNAIGYREVGGILILVSMLSGFVLLSIVTWNHSKMD